MTRLVVVLRRVTILRLIAAANAPATQTRAQMNPRVAEREALVTSLRAWHDRLDLLEMRALGFRTSGGHTLLTTAARRESRAAVERPTGIVDSELCPAL